MHSSRWRSNSATNYQPGTDRLEEKILVEVLQQVNELDDTTAFLEAELADFSTMTRSK